MSSDHNSNRKLLRQIFLLLCLGLAGIPVYGQPPTNFSRELVADKLNEAISMAFLPSGEVLLLQKGGDIKLADPTGTPPVSLSNFMTVSNINTFGEHGLIAIAVDPNYSTNKYFYLYYTPGDINGQHAKERVSRFVDTGNPVTRLSSEQMIWESNEPWQGCCHTGGTLVFGGDGALYLVTGDDFDPNRSQQLNRAGGKAHRFFPDGSTPTDNPFYDGTPGMFNANGQIQTIYSYGIRNPFRGTYDPVTDRIFFSEVGGNNHQYAFEDVHVLQKGANFGWPGCGDSGSGRDAQGNCTNPSYVDPIFTYPHAGGGACVMGGPVYQGSSYPASYNGVYFYGDYVRQFIRYLTFDANDNVNGNFLFDPSAGKIVCLEQGPDGNLYYLMVRTGTNTSLGQGRLYRYTYASQNARPTCVNSSASVTTGTGPTLNVTFNGTVTDPEGDPLTYLWTFDDGNTQSGNVPANGILPAITHTYGKGTYQATLTVSDAFGSATCDPISIQVGIPPTATITSPADSSFFKAGQTLTFTGSGTDPDGSLSNSNYRWFVNLYNGGVIHPRQGPDVGSTTTFTVPTINHVPFLGNTGYVVSLIVTDNDGLSDTTKIFLKPDKTDVILDVNVPGATVSLDGVPRVTPFIFRDLKGFQFTLTAPNQCINGTEYIFDSWDHGGAQSHLITLPDTPITYKANYLAGNSCSSGACGTALGFDGLNDFVDIPDLTLSGDFTIEAWVYLAPGTTIDQKDGILSSATANHDINFYQSKARIFIGSDPIVANSDMRVGQWTHIAFVRDGNQLRYYHNSTLDKTVTTTWSSDFLLGLLGQTKAGFLQGGLDEIRIWNVARTSTEISNFYDQLVPSGTAGLTAYYRFDENSGIQDVFDQSSNNLNGFLGAFSTAGSDDPSRSLTNGPMLAACGNIGVPDPTVVIISPTPGTTFSTADATINWTVSNARSGDSVLLVLDGVTTQKFEAINGNATFSGLTSGPHIMYAYLLDDQGVTYSANSAKDTTSFIISTSGGSTAFCGMAAGFDGQDDFIEIPDQNISGDFTLEAWILFENGTQSTISNEDGISRSTTSNQDINFFNGYGRIFTGTGDAIVTDTRMRTNQWNHLAFVRSGTTLYVYLNGVLDKTVTNGWTGTLEVHQLGVSQSGFLAGAMDEIRIWNIARSATDLQNEYDQMISPGLAGLQAYYRLDETTGTQTVDDQTANEAHGTLGATSAAGADDPNRFQTSGPMLLACGTTPNTQPAISITQPTNGSIIASSSFTLIYSVVDADTSDEISLTLDGGTPVILAPQNGSYTFTGLANGNHTVVAQVLDENGTPYPNSTAKDTLQISILTGNGNSVCGMDVGFDGVNDIIEIPDLAVFGDFTIESWVYFANGSSSTVTRHDGIFRSVTGNHDINFHQRRPRLYVETDRIIGNTQMRTNRWYHIAFVREGNMLYLYLNGQLDQSVNTSWTGGVDIQQLGGAKAGLLTGKLDEFRVWDLARSQAEIADKSDERILGTSNGLLAYYRFDEGPGMQFVLDQTPNNQHGTLGVSSLSGFDDPARGTTNSPLAATCSQSPIPEPVFILTAPAEGFEAQVSQPVATFTLSDTVVLDSVFVTVNGPSAGTAVISGKTGTYTLPALASGSYEVIFQIVDQSGQPYTNATSADTVNLTVNTTAVCGTAKGFDGTDDFLEIPDITIAGDFTLEAWILFANGPTSSINQNDGIYRSSTSTQDLNFFARKGRIFTGNGDAIVTTTEFRPNQWNHVAFVRSGSYLYVYVNGILDNTQPNGWIGNLEIGQLGKTTSGFLAGALDEVRVWDIARTDIEIAAAFDTVITGNEAGLVAYYRMDEVSQEQLLVDLTETYDGTAGSTSLVGADDPNPFPTTNGFLSAICQPVVLPDPEVTITAPTPGFTFDSDTVSVSFTYNNARVKDSIFWQLDGGAFEVVPDTGGVEFYNVSNGIHTLIGTAQDEDGILYTNPEASDTINFVVNAQQGSSGQQGQCGTAMDFDGSGEVVDIPNLTLNGDFTIEAWIRFTNGAQSTITNADGLLRSTTTEHDINFHQGKPRLYVGHDPIIANTRLRTNRWYHVAFVRSGSTLYCYIDGSLDKTENTTWNGAFRIHELGAAKAGYLNGDLDEVRIWNVARTSTEVFSHYDQLVLPTTPGLVAYYRFDEAFGEQIVNDETPSQFHGTLGADTNASTDDPSRFTTTGAMAQACLTQPTTDPTVVFTAPTQGSTLTQNSAALSFSVANLLATDEVELVFNAGTPISLAPQSATYTFNSLPNGSYTAIIGVKDVGGNTYPNADARDTISFSVQVTGGNTSGNCGMAIGLDGSDDFVEIPDLTLTGDFTIEAWVFLDPAAPLNQEDGILRSTNLNQDINFYNNRPRIFSSGDKIVSQTVIGRGQWNYMAFVRSGTELSFYFNGLEDTSLITNWNGPFEIHQLGRTQAGFLEGAMDEVRIWDVARSYLEIQATFDSELQGTEPGLLAYYQFEKPVGEQVVTDSTNNSYHGSLGANTSIGLDDPIRFPATALLNATLFCSSSNQKNGPRQGILSPTDIPLEFRVFPNPADESVNIQANSSLSEKVLVQVVNALGQEVVSAEMLLENQQSKELSLKNLTSGLYYLNLTVLGQRHTHLLQVQK